MWPVLRCPPRSLYLNIIDHIQDAWRYVAHHFDRQRPTIVIYLPELFAEVTIFDGFTYATRSSVIQEVSFGPTNVFGDFFSTRFVNIRHHLSVSPNQAEPFYYTLSIDWHPRQHLAGSLVAVDLDPRGRHRAVLDVPPFISLLNHALHQNLYARL